MAALQQWLVANVPDGSTAKDVSVGAGPLCSRPLVVL